MKEYWMVWVYSLKGGTVFTKPGTGIESNTATGKG